MPRYVKSDGSNRQLRPAGNYYYCTEKNYDDPCSGAVKSYKITPGNITSGAYRDYTYAVCGEVGVNLVFI